MNQLLSLAVIILVVLSCTPVDGASGGRGLLEFDDVSVHLSELVPNQKSTWRFEAHNVSDGPVAVAVQAKSCGCIDATVEPASVLPGDRVAVELSAIPSLGAAVHGSAHLSVTSDSGTEEIVKLSMGGQVLMPDGLSLAQERILLRPGVRRVVLDGRLGHRGEIDEEGLKSSLRISDESVQLLDVEHVRRTKDGATAFSVVLMFPEHFPAGSLRISFADATDDQGVILEVAQM